MSPRHDSRRGRRARFVPLLTAIVAAGPLLYPAWITYVSRRRPAPSTPDPVTWPRLDVIIPAYREREVIAAKIDDVHANGYPGELEIVVVAEDPETAAEARRAGARIIEPEERLGKSEAINCGVAETDGSVIVITDADASLERGSLAALARWFEDPGVGAVAGEKQVIGSSQDLYWRYESLLKRAESREGSTVSVVGELLAFRRSLYRPIPADVIVDDLWIALDIVEAGGSVRYEPEAVAHESPTGSLPIEWERRTRTTNGALDTLRRRPAMLVPGRSPVAAQLWGHKVFRLLLGPLAHAALLLRALVSAPRSRLAAAFVGIHTLGALAIFRQGEGRRPAAPERALAQALFLQATALGGIARYLLGERPALWQKPERAGSTVLEERSEESNIDSLSPTGSGHGSD
jgi:cellulose synthase/poly-beta-1,6-N-acetylglucosamine synthase-like glycosyltransferase